MRIHDFPGQNIRINYTSPEEIRDPKYLAHIALKMIFSSFEGLCEFLSVEVALAYCDEIDYPISEIKPPNPFCLIHQHILPEDVEIKPSWEQTQISTTRIISLYTIIEWLSTILSQNHSYSNENTICWQEINFLTTRARTIGTNFSGRTLLIDQSIGMIEHPFERCGESIWVTGPLKFKTLNAPIELRLANEIGFFTLDITLHWSLWTEQGSPGKQMLEQTLNRLRAAGWVDG